MDEHTQIVCQIVRSPQRVPRYPGRECKQFLMQPFGSQGLKVDHEHQSSPQISTSKIGTSKDAVNSDIFRNQASLSAAI